LHRCFAVLPSPSRPIDAVHLSSVEAGSLCLPDTGATSNASNDSCDPKDIGGPLEAIPAHRFNFPLQSVESVTPVDDFTLLVGLDNNYPGGNGRVPGTPDGTEMILLRSTHPLKMLRVVPTFPR
jgi:hypothetical protein